MSTSIEKIADYGNGTYEDTGSPLVLVGYGPSEVYHRHDHGGRLGCVTFTEDFARNGIGLRPCRSCWPSRAIGASE